MKVLVVSATTFEQIPFIEFLENHWVKKNFSTYTKGQIEINPFVHGVGSLLTAFSLAKQLNANQYDLAIQVGVAGSYAGKFTLGDVVNVETERMGDLGAEEKNEELVDVFELGLIKENQFPFMNGLMQNPKVHEFQLPLAHSISVNKVSGATASIRRITQKYNADIENMEGAAFFYACLMQDLPFLEIRGISNIVEERNRENWRLDLAIDNVNRSLIEIVNGLEQV